MSGPSALTVFLACAAIGASAALHAQARGPAVHAMRSSEQQIEKPPLVMDEAARARKSAELEAWLGRLTGRFRADATRIHVGGTETIPVTAQCSRFGDGPGVRCVIQQSRPWPVRRLSVDQLEGTYQQMTFPLLYFGITPDNLEVQAIVVDLEQVGAQSGPLAGDTVKFSDNWKACLKLWAHCWMVAEIAARPAGEMFMRIVADAWYQGTRGPPMTRTKDGHTNEFDMHFYRDPAADAPLPGAVP